MDVLFAGNAAPATVDELAKGVKESFAVFLDEFQVGDEFIYRQKATMMQQEEKTTLYIDFEHVVEHDEATAEAIQNHYLRVKPYLSEALRAFVLKYHPEYEKEDSANEQIRTFVPAFHHASINLKIRDLKTEAIGKLVSIQGTIVRTQAVHPELSVGVFQCRECKTMNEDVEQRFKYTQPLICRNPACDNRSEFKLITDQSKFVDFQKIRIQESSDEIPSGSMPRSVDIVLRHEIVENAKAGDKALINGTLIVVPDVAQLSGSGRGPSMNTRGGQREGYSQDGITGLKSLGVRDLQYKMVFLASTVMPSDSKLGIVNVREENATPESVVSELTEAEREELISMKDDPKIYDKIANSIAPSVFGHEEIKRGIALMLFGGVHKSTGEGINLRGDLNVCLVGDPSTSKSQFLKYVVDFVPRAVYTSGKASTAAGLTAAVVKDEDSNDFFIEAGALMLADNGICCIDEFDKMDTKDQVAIHEAMEQQTISIAKANVQATLNARTSVLAAANPIAGRYDRSKSLKANVNMTAPIMSRFDLFFVVVDECNDVSDYNIARHITSMHRFMDDAIKPEYTTQQLQRYIKFARTLKPRISEESRKVMVQQYKKLRQHDASGLTKSSYRITVRQLESMVRLSEGLARLHCDDEIKPAYVHEACRLLQKSIVQVESEDVQLTPEDGEDQVNDDGNDDDGDGDKPDDADEAANATGEAASDALASSSQGDALAKKQTTISYEKYMQIANQIIQHLRQLERASELPNTEDDDEVDEAAEKQRLEAEAQQRKSKVVAWYLDSVEKQLESMDQLAEEKKVVGLVLHRMIDVDRVLLEVSQYAEMVEDDAEDEDKVLIVHPNYEAATAIGDFASQ